MMGMTALIWKKYGYSIATGCNPDAETNVFILGMVVVQGNIGAGVASGHAVACRAVLLPFNFG